MASSTDSPSEYARHRRQQHLAVWRELLPGIEDFLVRILSQEKLSGVAEERRQYFVERLDILRLPPSLPPRAGKRLSMELLEESEEQCGIPADQVPELGLLLPENIDTATGSSAKQEATVAAAEGVVGGSGSRNESEAEKDFAAEQRKISRNMVVSVSSDKDVAGAGDEDIEDSDSAQGVKVYDDIDPTESIKATDQNTIIEVDDDDDDINALYEIPVARLPQQVAPPSEDNSLSQPADVSSSMATTAGVGSIDDISDDVLDAAAPPWQPPPLPPRTKKESQSAESRLSTHSLESGVTGGAEGGGGGAIKPPDLPFRPPLPRRNELYARSEKSDKSEKSDVSDGNSTSYESFDENENENNLKSKPSIKLPKRSKKKSKSGGGTTSKLLSSKARSSSTWEINVPFKKLDTVLMSGEMLHKGKLSYNRRLVAISNGCLALYKPDKETRPVFVIPLAGFSACLGEPLGRKGFEMKMTHGANGESYTFAVDFKEWVNLWCELINGLSQGLSVPAYHQHLARTFSAGSEPTTFGSKADLTLEEEEEGDYEVYEAYTTDSSSVFSSPPLTPKTLRFDPQCSLRSPEERTLHSSATMSRLLTRTKTAPPPSRNRSFTTLSSSGRAASTLTLSRWDWKTLFYNLNFPLDQIVMILRRRGNLASSSLSLSSDGVESDDSSKPRLRANKVMRMGSFAYRATQFFENLGKKSTSKRKTSSLSSPTDIADYSLRDGIQEESSLSSVSTGGAAVSPSSEATSPVFEDSFRNSSTFSSPSSTMEFPPLPPTPPPAVPSNVKQQGYLNIFSSFRKRWWGLRWCVVRENMFECYRTQMSESCELNFLLRRCVVRQALAETHSPLSLMLLDNDKEKITVEPLSKEELSQWLRVLMMETATESVPPGLEEYFVEVDENQVEDLTAALEAEYSDIMGVGASVLKSWEVGSVPILPSADKTSEDTAQKPHDPTAVEHSNRDREGNNPSTETSAAAADNDDDDDGGAEGPRPDKYLYSTVIKRPSFPALEQVEGATQNEEEEEEEEEELTQQLENGKIPHFTNNLAVYNANKKTTDSGFYSVKEANSDSESGSDAKRDRSVSSPAMENHNSLLSASPAELASAASAVCNTTWGKGISDSTGGKGQAGEEEEDEESALEKTMTSEDFKDSLDGEKRGMSDSVKDGGGQDSVKDGGGQDASCSAVNTEHAEEESEGCKNSMQSASTDRVASLPNSADLGASGGGGGTRDKHVHSDKVDAQLANSEDAQQRDKTKRKKKKGKGKKNKGKQLEQEHAPSGKGSVDSAVPSNPKSQSKPDYSETSPGIPNCSTSSVNQVAEGSQSSAHKQSHRGASESSFSTPSPEDRVEVGTAKGPEEDQMAVELKERIGQLREKLVQIKRKRIAVRDKRVRAFSIEERTVCDKEYLVLESECKETAAIIQNLEAELKAATAVCVGNRS